MGLHAGSHHPSMRLPRSCEGRDTRVLTVVIYVFSFFLFQNYKINLSSQELFGEVETAKVI